MIFHHTFVAVGKLFVYQVALSISGYICWSLWALALEGDSTNALWSTALGQEHCDSEGNVQLLETLHCIIGQLCYIQSKNRRVANDPWCDELTTTSRTWPTRRYPQLFAHTNVKAVNGKITNQTNKNIMHLCCHSFKKTAVTQLLSIWVTGHPRKCWYLRKQKFTALLQGATAKVDTWQILTPPAQGKGVDNRQRTSLFW